MRKRRHAPLMLAAAVLLVPFVGLRSCSRNHVTTSRPGRSSSYKEGSPMSFASASFALSSTAVSNRVVIAQRYTCDGADISPKLDWEGVPAGTQSLALIADDPDAPMGTWTHWIIWNIPAEASALAVGLPKVELLDIGARQGTNDFKRVGYGGPCPPPGKPHRYFFKLYALDARLDLKAGARRNELELAMKRHVLSQTELIGTYQR